MKAIKKTISCCILFCLPLLGFTQNKLRLAVNTDVHYQTIDGFGASDAWRCQFVGKNWPLEKREKIADWLFSTEFDLNGNPKGIGLSIWRFYLAAGTAEQGDSSGIQNPWRRGECFLSPAGVWDWSKYEGQRWFLQAAKKRGVEKFLAFTIAPPVQLTLNGKGFAKDGNINFNIKSGKTSNYAAYLGEVLDHFKTKQGIEFDYLSPFNEPQWNWDQGNQEGTPATNKELFDFLKDIAAELNQRKLKTEIVVGEAATIEHIYKTVSNDGRDNQMEAFFSPLSPFYIGDLPNVAPLISAHSYFTVWPVSFQIQSRKDLAEKMVAVNPKIGYWQSEYCILEKNDEIGQGAGRDLGIPTALFIARIIHNDLTLCNARSWQWWTALTQCDYKDGLVYLDSGTETKIGQIGTQSLQFDGTARDSKLMWAIGNYSHFIRPGMIRVETKLLSDKNPVEQAEGVMVSGYIDPNNKHLVVVCVNTSHNDYSLDPAINTGNPQIDIYVTSKEKNLFHEQVKRSNIHIPSRSIITLCFQLE